MHFILQGTLFYIVLVEEEPNEAVLALNSAGFVIQYFCGL